MPYVEDERYRVRPMDEAAMMGEPTADAAGTGAGEAAVKAAGTVVGEPAAKPAGTVVGAAETSPMEALRRVYGTRPTGPQAMTNPDEVILKGDVGNIGAERIARGERAKAERDYNDTLSGYIKNLADMAERPDDPETKRRKERAAMAVGGIGALGNIANAFSNLVWTGQGAPSQTLPTAPDADTAINKYREEDRAKAKNFLENEGRKLALIKAEREYKDARGDADRNYQLKRDAEKAKAEKEHAELLLKIKKAEDDGNLSKAKQLTEKYKAEEARIKAEYAPKQQEADIEVKKASVQQKKASASASWANAAKAKAGSVKELPLSDGSMIQIPTTAWNEGAMRRILATVGDPAQVTTTSKDLLTGEEKPTTRDMKMAEMVARIGELLEKGDSETKAILDRGLREISTNRPKIPKNSLKPEESKTDW